MVYTYSETVSGLQRKDILTPATSRTNLEDIMLSDVSQLPRDKHHTTVYTRYPEGSASWRHKAAWWVPGKKEPEGCLMHGVSVWEDEKALELEGGEGCTPVGAYGMPWTGHLETVKMVTFVLCGFGHNFLKVLNTGAHT